MASAIRQLSQQTLTLAGTRQRLSTSAPVICSSVTVIAESTNSGTVYVGDVAVSSTNGIPLTAGQSASIGSEHDNLDLYQIYWDGSASSDKIRIVYVERKSR